MQKFVVKIPKASTHPKRGSCGPLGQTSACYTTKGKAHKTQMYLDLGQKSFGCTQKCVHCGMIYTKDDEEDLKNHRLHCSRHVALPVMTSLSGHKVIRKYENTSVSGKIETNTILHVSTASTTTTSYPSVAIVRQVLDLVIAQLGSHSEIILPSDKIFVCIRENGTVMGCIVCEKLHDGTDGSCGGTARRHRPQRVSSVDADDTATSHGRRPSSSSSSSQQQQQASLRLSIPVPVGTNSNYHCNHNDYRLSNNSSSSSSSSGGISKKRKSSGDDRAEFAADNGKENSSAAAAAAAVASSRNGGVPRSSAAESLPLERTTSSIIDSAAVHDKKIAPPTALLRAAATSTQERCIPAAGAATAGLVMGVKLIWTAAAYRRQHVAQHLLDCARQGFLFGRVLSIEEIAFSQPTQEGFQFACHYCTSDTIWAY